MGSIIDTTNLSPAASATTDAWSVIGGPAHSIASYADRIAALNPDRSQVFSRDPATGAWESIGGAASKLVSGGWDLYAASPDLYRYDGMSWQRIGDAAAQFVAIGNAVYALTPDRSKVLRYDRYDGTWTQIGGAAERLVDGGAKLYAVEPGGAALHEYSRFDRKWTRIGGPGDQFVGVGGTVYALAVDRNSVHRYDGTPDVWTQVGGPALKLVGGGSMVYAVQPGTNTVWRYTGVGQLWTEIGPAGTGQVAFGERLYSLASDKQSVREHDPANDETRRLRTLLYAANDAAKFGRRIKRGFFARRIGATAIAEHNADVTFQPVSCLKLLPYLQALVEIDTGKSTLDTQVTWTEELVGDDGENKCLQPGQPGTRQASAPYRDALPTMMWVSHNRTLEALLNRMVPRELTRAAQARGLRQTEMYYGCRDTDAPVGWWAHNMSSLKDLARMFEGVETLSYVAKPATRALFHGNMEQSTAAPGTTYHSPISGRTITKTNEFLRTTVQQEAGIAKAGIVDEFMRHVVVRMKVGGGNPSGDEFSYGEVMSLTVPLKIDGRIQTVVYVLGWYLSQARVSIEHDNADPALEVFKAELYRVALRQALATW